MYKELLLFPEKLKDEVIYPDIARKIVAEACDGSGVSSMIFSRYPLGTIINGNDMSGKTVPTRYGDTRSGARYPAGTNINGQDVSGELILERRERPGEQSGNGAPPYQPIVFDGGRGFIRIYGLGRGGANLLTEQTGHIISALQSHLGPSRVELNTGEFALKVGRPTMYRIRRIVVAKKPFQIARFIGKSAEQCADALREEIVRSIVATASWLDEDSGSLADSLESKIPSNENVMVDILGGQPMPILISPGVAASGFANVEFCSNLELTGPWAAGKLLSRGYGFIRRRIER